MIRHSDHLSSCSMACCGRKQVIKNLYAKVNDSYRNNNNNDDNWNKEIPNLSFMLFRVLFSYRDDRGVEQCWTNSLASVVVCSL